MGDDRWWDHMDGGVMDGRHMGGAAWWPLWWLLLVFVVVGVVAVVVLSTRPRTTHPTALQGPSGQAPAEPAQPARDPAEALLRERYARGEIDQTEYDERLVRLRASR